MGLNLDWVKSYDLKCSLRHLASSASSKKIATDKKPFWDHIWPCLTNYAFIFHKTEIPTVILRCLMGPNLDLFKSYDTKRKYFHFFFFVILFKNSHLHLLCKEFLWLFWLFVYLAACLTSGPSPPAGFQVIRPY